MITWRCNFESESESFDFVSNNILASSPYHSNMLKEIEVLDSDSWRPRTMLAEERSEMQFLDDFGAKFKYWESSNFFRCILAVVECPLDTCNRHYLFVCRVRDGLIKEKKIFSMPGNRNKIGIQK